MVKALFEADLVPEGNFSNDVLDVMDAQARTFPRYLRNRCPRRLHLRWPLCLLIDFFDASDSQLDRDLPVIFPLTTIIYHVLAPLKTRLSQRPKHVVPRNNLSMLFPKRSFC